MKILEINSVCGIRSTGRICTDIAELLKENGHECRIVYGRESVPKKYESISYRVGTENDVRLHALKSRLFDASGFGSKYATQRLIEYINEYNPDIIHLHNIHGYYINIELLFDYLKKINKPVVWTMHDCWAFTGHCTYFDFCKCERWKTGCFKCPQVKEYPASFFFDNSSLNWKRKKELFTGIKNLICVTPSKWLAELVKSSFLKENRVYVIPNGIDLNSFRPTYGDFKKKVGIEGKNVYLGVASTWDKRKGLDAFISLSAMLNKDEVLVLVGLSNEQLQELPKNIIGIQQTNNVEELAEIYTAADVLLNPTFEDNYPTVNLEAQACGTPVITFKTGGSPETIFPDSGYVVEQNDVEALLESARQLKFDRESILKNVSKFDKQRRYYEYLMLYDNLYEEYNIKKNEESI